jgi:hypothetical protein
MKILDSGMKDKLPSALYDAVKGNIVDAWKEVSKSAVKTRNDVLPQALDFFKKSNNHDYGKIYQDNRSDLQKAVEEELAGRPSDSKSAMESARKAAEKAKTYFSDEVLFNRYKMVVSGAVMKARNFSQVLSYEELQYTEVEIVAILDQKTSSICKFMNGRRIQIKTAANYVREYMDTDPSDVTARFGWPKRETVGEMQGKSTADAVKGLGAKLPPYHAHCRTTVVPGYTERVGNQNGKKLLLGNYKKPPLTKITEEDKIPYKESLNLRMKEYDNLTEDEFASKINSSRYSQWSEKNLKKHFDYHAYEFGEITIDDYKKISEKVLTKFDNLYLYNVDGDNRLMFYNMSENIGTVVSTDDNNIIACFKPDQYYKDRTIENLYIKIK